MSKMKAPTKQSLYDEIKTLNLINQRLVEERDRERIRQWEEKIPQAFEECRKQLSAIFPNLLTMLRFEHVDAGGYWFTFHLTNDQTVQRYAVRHSDL